MSNLIQGTLSSFSIEEHIKYSNLPELAITILEQMEEEYEQRIAAAQECDSNDEDDLQEQVDDLKTQVEELEGELSKNKYTIMELRTALSVANTDMERYKRFVRAVKKRIRNGSFFITYEMPFGLHSQIHTALVENDLDFDV
jgi:predicted RNase H-like nuclease (RuvC/YqgF family)